MKKFWLALACTAGILTGYSQEYIFNLMERRDLRIQDIEKLANDHFKQTGRGQGTGDKQFQRWLFEQKFHTDDKGFLLEPDYDWKEYNRNKSLIKADAAGTWVEMGPKSWSRTSGWNPGVGRITSVAVNPADTQVIYVSSPGGGIWKTSNGGSSWSPLVDQNSSWMNVFHMCVDPNSPNTVYAALSSGGVIKSTDAGATWAATGSGPSGSKKVLVQPGNSSIVFATANNGIWRSTNAGGTWTQVQNTGKEDIEFKPGDVNIMYASSNGTNAAVWRSTDNGITWTVLGAAQGITTSGRTLIGVSAANPEVVYAVQASGSIFGRMYRSLNSGLTFDTTVTGSATRGTNYFGYETNGKGTTGQATYDMAITVNPLDANEVHIAGIICWRSLNGGFAFSAMTAWSLPNSIGYNHADVHALEWVNKTIYSGSDGGIYKSTDHADNWTDLTSGLGIRQFYRMASSKTNPYVFQGGAQDNGTSLYKSSTSSWIDWLGADGMDCLISPTNESLVWGTSQYGALYRSTTQGSSYSGLGQPSNGQWVTPLAIEANTNVIYGGWTGVYKSTDNGSTWTNLSSGVITTTLACLAVAPSNPQYIYASNGTTLWVTTNGGGSWALRTASGTITSIEVSPTLPDKVFITTSSGTYPVMVSTDTGATFTNLKLNLPGSAGRSVKVDATNEGLYVGMNIGVYYKDSTMTSWVDLSGNLPKVAVNEVEIQKSGGKLRVATYGRGIWETDLYATGASCGTPGSLGSSSITTSSATLGWGTVAGATGYNLQYRPDGGNFTSVSNIATNSYNLAGLIQNTTYEWQVQAVCSQGNSTYSALSSFATLADPCPAPATITASNITTSSADISWSVVANALSYDLQYKKSADATYTPVNGITGTSYNLTGLSSSTTYQYLVRPVCSTGAGDYTTVQSFTTAALTCSAPANVSATPTGTTATLSWTAVPGADYYYVRYKKSNVSTWTQTANFTSTSYTVSGLTTKTNYNAEVRVVCLNGLTNSTSVNFRTANRAPTAPAQGTVTYNEDEVVVAPNPVRSTLMVTLKDGLITRDATIQVFDMYGRMLRTVPVKGSTTAVEIGNLPTGSYRVRWSGAGKSITKPFMKE